MAEIIDRNGVLERVRGFSPLQRVLLTTAGTLQGTLSAFLGSPVTIALLQQREVGDGDLKREVELVCSARQLVVCHAATDVHVTNPTIRRLVLDAKLGLGQISATLTTPTSFALDEVGDEHDLFWRIYQLWGDGYSYRIHEKFPKRLYDRLEETYSSEAGS